MNSLKHACLREPDPGRMSGTGGGTHWIGSPGVLTGWRGSSTCCTRPDPSHGAQTAGCSAVRWDRSRCAWPGVRVRLI
jgi:hypothetical protein